MIEAVNAVVSNAPFLRASAEQVAVSQAAEVQESVAAAPQAPYVSPHIFVDVNFDKAVLQIRDSDTGDVLSQFPSEEALRLRQSTGPLQQAPAPAQRQQPQQPAQQPTVTVPEGSKFSNAQAQVAAAALAKTAQAATTPQTTTVVTSA